LLLRDKAPGTELFLHPVPVLTHIWISPDSKYVVGISNIMLWNPYQLIVFSKSGDRLLEGNLVGVKWPGVSQSVANSINWYKEPVPKMTIVEKGTTTTLLRSRSKTHSAPSVNFNFMQLSRMGALCPPYKFMILGFCFSSPLRLHDQP
jgi:hypothetical protein